MNNIKNSDMKLSNNPPLYIDHKTKSIISRLIHANPCCFFHFTLIITKQFIQSLNGRQESLSS